MTCSRRGSSANSGGKAKRSTAFSRPTDATWIRSSRGSPRLANRRARYSAKPRWAVTRWSRRPGSRLSAYCSNFLRSSSRSSSGMDMATSSSGVVPLHQTELRAVFTDGQLVLVDDGLQDLVGERRQRRARPHAVVEQADALHDQAVVLHPVAEGDGPRPPTVADEREAQLVDGYAKVLDLVVGE